jgi:CBS domain containing-hemolysin-like protein
MLAGFVGSALCSGLETGCYTLNRVRLHLLAMRGRPAAVSLHKLLEDPTVLLSTLLIGNNIANYVGTYGLAVILQRAGLGVWQEIVLNVLIITPMLFIFGETLPKDYFAAQSDRVMYRLAPLLRGMRLLLTVVGLVPLVAGFSKALLAALGQRGQEAVLHPRRRVQALMREGAGHGGLEPEQTDLLERVFATETRIVKQEMVPWRDVQTLQLDDPPATLFELADRTSWSRFPVIAGSGEHRRIVGVVEVMDALVYGPWACPPLRSLIHPVMFLHARTPLLHALTDFQHRKLTIGIVVEDDQPIGIVTMKDLVEPVTGQLSAW